LGDWSADSVSLRPSPNLNEHLKQMNWIFTVGFNKISSELLSEHPAGMDDESFRDCNFKRYRSSSDLL
jgi:hypothetical protein